MRLRYVLIAVALLTVTAAHGVDLDRVLVTRPVVATPSSSDYVMAVMSSASGKVVRRSPVTAFGNSGSVAFSRMTGALKENTVKALAYDTTAAEGSRYIFPYNGSTPFAGTPAIGMMQTTAAGPQWYNGTEWAAIGVAYDDSALWAKFADYLLKAEHDAYVAAAQVKFDNFSTQISQLKAAVVAGGGTLSGSAPSTLPPLAFGDVISGQSSTLTAEITNEGLGDLVIGTATKSGTGEAKFTLNGGCSGQTVIPGASCLESITFTPGTAGTYTAQISFPHNASGAPTLLDVSGTGLAAAACGSTPYADIATAATSESPLGQTVYNAYSGIIVEAGQTTRSVCKVAFYVQAIYGAVSGVDYRAEIWSLDGNKSLSTMKRASNSISGATITAGSYLVVSLTPEDLVSGNALVFTRADHGTNGTNYIAIASSTVADTGPSGGYSHSARWNQSLALAAESTTSDKRVQIYGVQ